MLELFKSLVPPEQKELAVMVETMGGNAALENEQSMKELATAERAFPSYSGPGNRHGGDRPFDFVELQLEIKAKPDEAIEKNADFFSRMFDIQKRQIIEIERTINREGDRIISTLTAGPHDRIVDQV